MVYLTNKGRTHFC